DARAHQCRIRAAGCLSLDIPRSRPGSQALPPGSDNRRRGALDPGRVTKHTWDLADMSQDQPIPGASAAEDRAPESSARPAPVVAFDFDGTLTVRDSFIAFLRWRTSGARWALGLLRLAPAALAYLVHRDRGRIKAAAVAEFLKGVPRADLEAEAKAF